ncbi:hypothetical protein XELAEV_18032424mg [Xenopus laevis]|uniref:Uncharacterized protein n=1 Tax=Xenopus laevis TaxID=8355 RepID=A0A974CR53_XENLA|nr:hypothetical protein XELAEV_18032424mg [Xenopus laevis]
MPTYLQPRPLIHHSHDPSSTTATTPHPPQPRPLIHHSHDPSPTTATSLMHNSHDPSHTAATTPHTPQPRPLIHHSHSPLYKKPPMSRPALPTRQYILSPSLPASHFFLPLSNTP